MRERERERGDKELGIQQVVQRNNNEGMKWEKEDIGKRRREGCIQCEGGGSRVHVLDMCVEGESTRGGKGEDKRNTGPAGR